MESIDQAKREWDKAFNAWVVAGCPDNENDDNWATAPKPGAHPEGDHDWNKDPEQFLKGYKASQG